MFFCHRLSLLNLVVVQGFSKAVERVDAAILAIMTAQFCDFLVMPCLL